MYELISFNEDIEEWVDIETGEILSLYRRPPINMRISPYEQYKPKKRKFKKSLDWVDCNTINRAHMYMEKVDKRSLILKNDVIPIHNHDCGVANRKGHDPYLSKDQVEVLNRLVENILYRNMVFLTSEQISKVLDTKNITRELNKVEGVIDILPSKKGEWIIAINPAYGWRYIREGINKYREVCLNQWIFKNSEYDSHLGVF